MNAIRYSVLGGFFFVTMFVLGVLTIYLGKWNPFEESFTYEVYFDDVDGLRAGDAVLVYGVQTGRVDHIEATGETGARRLRVHLLMEQSLALREDYSFRISAQSLLGGKRLDVNFGTGDALRQLDDLRGYSTGDVLKEFGDLIAENRGGIRDLVASIAAIARDIQTREASLLSFVLDPASDQALAESLQSVQSITAKIDRGDGSLARLLNEGEVLDRVQSILQSGDLILTEIAAGDGTLARLVRDPALFEELQATFSSLRFVAQNIEHGHGLLGWATSEQSREFTEKVEATLLDIHAITDQVRGGRGLVGRLVMNDELATTLDDVTRNVGDITSRLRALVVDVQAGRGIVGYLLADDAARREIVKIVRMIASTLEDIREAAPVSSVASFLFGSL